MAATPADIAKYTNDGETVTLQLPTLRALHPQARDLGEIPTFFRYTADAQAMLDEKQAALSGLALIHETIEVGEALAIGSTIPETPTVPTFRIIDDDRSLNQLARVIATAFDMTTDRYSVEVAS